MCALIQNMPLTLYKSSAGSGKTYTLVREYIKLLVANPYHYKNILAITFTNKATEEMKHRIISALAKLADGSCPDLEAYLLAYFREHGIRPIGILRKKELDKVDELSEIAPTAAQKEVEETADEATELPLIYGKNIKATTIKYRCEKALQLILHNYSQFNVSTIDSFFQQVLRSFTKELKLPQKYEIEMNSSFALDQITAKLLLDIGRVAGLTEWLQSFAFAQIENDKGWNIERNIKELGFQIFKEAVWERLKNADLQDQSLVNDFKLKELHQALTQEKPQLDDESIENKMADAESEQKAKIAAEKLKIRNERYKELKTIINGLWALKQGFEQTMRQYGQEAMELIKGYGLTIKDFKTGTANYFGNIQKGNYEVKATLQKIYDGDEKQWYAAKSAKKENIIMLVQNGLQDVLTEAINYHKKHLKQYNSASEVLKNIYVYGILNDLRDKLIDFRTENNLMMISDTNNLLRLIISDNEAAFIFEKVGIQFKHVLIDEFQDTSDYQWFNLLPLVTNTLSEGNSALIVGDVKQSIYRWRGGNMHLLLEGVRRDLPHFFDENTEQALDTNYRSREHIVRFNNAFFETAVNALMQHLNIPEAFQIKAAYSSLKQKIKHHGGGYVKVQSFVDGQEESWKEQAKTSLINSIHELLETGFELRDIALLVRRNVEGNDLAEFLAKNDIKVISSESLLLKNSLKVQLLISVLFYLIDNRNSIARTEVLVHYLKLYPNEAIDWQNPDSLHLLYTDYSIENEANSLFYTLLPPLFTQHLPELVKLPLYALIEQLLQIFAMNQQADAYIQRFQDLVLEYNTTQGADIRHFLIWWTDNKDKEATSIIVPEGENAVTVMTIHKAKGLEFPVVFLPFCEWNLKPKPGSILWTESHEAPFDKLGPMPVLFNDKLADSYFWEEYEREILASYIDNLNMLYVAFTRPTDHLYIYTKKYKAPSSKTAKNDLNAVHKLLYTVLHQFEFADNN